jgi:PAS domain S-box-containing protein
MGRRAQATDYKYSTTCFGCIFCTRVGRLAEFLEPYRVAYEASPVAMAFVSLDWCMLECNPAMCGMLGRSKEELDGRAVNDFTHPDDRHLHDRPQQRLRAGEIDSYHMDGRYLHSSGYVGWVSVNVGVLRDDTGEIQMAIALAEDITERRWMREIHDRLLGLVLVGQGNEALADALADLIESPVALLDGYGQLLAEGHHADRRRAIPSREQLAGADLSKFEGLIIRPLHLGDQLEGYLIAEEPPGAQHLTARAIEQAASTFALQLAMSARAEETEHRLHGDLFTALLGPNPPDTPSLLRWGQRLGHDLSTFKTIAFVRPINPAPETAPDELTRLARVAGDISRELAPGSFVVPRGDAILIALTVESTDNGETLTKRLIDRLDRHTGVPTVAGLSREIPGPADLATALREARQAVDATIAVPRLRPIAVFDRLYIQHLLLGKQAPDDIVQAAERTLKPLFEHPDIRHRQNLITTLAVYLDSVGNLKTTARRLSIHINTLRLRITRIEQLLQLELHEPQTRVNLQLALEVLELDRRPTTR